MEILSDILDFAKPSPLELKPLPLAPLIKAALEPIWVRFDERGPRQGHDRRAYFSGGVSAAAAAVCRASDLRARRPIIVTAPTVAASPTA